MISGTERAMLRRLRDGDLSFDGVTDDQRATLQQLMAQRLAIFCKKGGRRLYAITPSGFAAIS